MKSIEELNLSGHKVVLRVDFNVPLDDNLEITDDTRMRLTLPTIEYLLGQGCQLFLLAHLGRPQKKRLPNGELDIDRFSLKPLVKPLAKMTQTPVGFGTLDEVLQSKKAERLVLVENTRFWEGEKKGDASLAEKMALLGDYYVNDAFGAAHRRHASTATIAEFFDTDHKAPGFLMTKEIKEAHRLLNSDESPFVAIVGGAKVSDKLGVLEKLIEVCDTLLIGGAMAYTFVKSAGGKIGNSLVEEDKLDLAEKILAKAIEKKTNLILPTDSVVAREFADNGKKQIVPSDEIPDGWMGLDIGPQAVKEYTQILQESQRIFWNGPMGVFEMESFAQGTFGVANAVAEATEHGAYSLIGGGDSVAAVQASGNASRVSFISSGGGAMLEFLEGKDLPGLEALKG